MVRTVIEISAETEWDHDRQLRSALDNIGYEQKRSEEYGRNMADLFAELRERGLDPEKIIEERRERLRKKAA
jgi:S-adenosylmethionine synthetase